MIMLMTDNDDFGDYHDNDVDDNDDTVGDVDDVGADNDVCNIDVK